MLLQPFIENAIWHGLRYKEEKGYLKLQLQAVAENTLKISISDNGIGRRRSAEIKTKHQKKQRSQGMENIRKRIAILNDMYGDEIRVSVSDLEEDGSGTLVVLTLKKKE
jgi:sensor histidine kinase YesM